MAPRVTAASQGLGVAQFSWQLRLLDNFRLVGMDGDVPLSSRKAAALLTYLALQQNGMARREVIATLLWENTDPSQARVSLRQALAAVRRVEGDLPPILVSEGEFLRLSADVDVDVARFEQLAAGDTRSRAEAVELYRTDLMGGFSLRDAPAFNEWLMVEQARIRQRVIAALQGLIDDALATGGDLNSGVANALHLLSLDPFNEVGHRGLMQLYARQGRASLALTQFRSLSDLLRKELAVTPEAETIRLHEEIKSGRRRLAGDRASSQQTSAQVMPEPSPDIAFEPVGEELSAPDQIRVAASRGKRRTWFLTVLALLAGAITVLAVVLWPQPSKPPILGEIYPIAKSDDPEVTPAISPDGEQVVFAMTRANNTDLYLLPASGEGQPIRLTDGPDIERSAQWRPDGKAIAFVRFPRLGDRPCEIVLKPMPAGDERIVGRCLTDWGTALSWMPDGKTLVFRDMPRLGAPLRIYSLDVDSGKALEISHPPATVIGDIEPSVSADGKRIVFHRIHAIDAMELMMLDLETGQETSLVKGLVSLWGSIWQRGGRGIVFSATFNGDSGLWWIDPQHPNAPHRLSAGIAEFRYLSYAAEKQRLVFEAMQTRESLLQLAPDSTAATPAELVPGIRPGLFSRFPMAASNGDIVFVASRSGGDELWILSPGQSARQRTRFKGWRMQDLSWSPDGSWIAFIGVRSGVADLYVLPARGGEPIRLTKDAVEDTMPEWSSDGQTIYFGSRRSGAWRIWNIDPARPGQVRQVSDDGVWRALPSPDGKFLYYVIDGQRGIRRKALVAGRLAGPEEMIVKDLHPYHWRGWGMARNGLFYLKGDAFMQGSGSVYRHDLATGKEALVTDAAPLAFTLASSGFSVRPDGGLLLAKRETQLDIYGAELD